MQQVEVPADKGVQINSTELVIPAEQVEQIDSPRSGRAPRIVPPPVISAFHVFDPDASLAAPQLFFEGFLEAEEMAVYLGREKSRKSSVLLQLAFCAALGKDFLDIPFVHPRPLKVTIFDFESKENSMKGRWENLSQAMELTADNRELLRENLKIVLLRKTFAAGGVVPRFTVKGDENADEYWRSAVRTNPADLYIIDPFRNLHNEGENDSTIEGLLAKIRRTFGKSAVIIAHHMVKRSANKKENVKLIDDMRLFSDGGRGSGAIKGYCDVIINQEWSKENGEEIIHWGAFGKNIADLAPRALVQTAENSGFWVPTEVDGLSRTLKDSLKALKENVAELLFENNTQAADLIMRARGLGKSAAHVHVTALASRGLIEVNMAKYAEKRGPSRTFEFAPAA